MSRVDAGDQPAETRDAVGTPGSAVAPAMYIRLLGGFEVQIAGKVVPEGAWRLRKARSLVKLLALAPAQRLPREQVRDALWPERDAVAADNNLRGTLHAARQALVPHGAIVSRGGTLALVADAGLGIDVVAFQEAVAAARRGGALADYAAALDCYGGELLPEDRYEDWATGRRDSLRGLYLALLRDLAELHERAGDWTAAIAALQRLLVAEPTDETAQVALMRLHALAGQRTLALARWDQLVATLRRELDAEPDAPARALRDEIAAGRFPPTDGIAALARGGRYRHNLPIAATALIGREADLAAVKGALAASRLVTLTGAGGCGKTRLALAAATELLAAYPDGVWFVDLAPLSAPGQVAGAVSGALGVREEAARPLLETLADRLAEGATLLVLDNCEHLLDACAGLAGALLGACPRLRVLATSRAALGLAGEAGWRVPSLRLPPASGAPRSPGALAALGAVPAVRLFVERARQHRPEFALTATNGRAVAEIARRLDGIPLALELAAARLAILPVAALAARLDDALRLLTGGGRAAVPRQQTLRATLDWSYALLTLPQQVLLARLSVFAGGGTLAAIEAVCGDEVSVGTELGADAGLPPSPFSLPAARFSLLDALAALADQSLVQVDADDDAGRYRLHETTRQYAAERLAASAEGAAIRQRHADYHAGLAERADGALSGPEGQAWIGRLDLEHDNCRAALGWAQATGRYEIGQRLAGALIRFWSARGHLREGRAWLEGLLAPGAATDPRVRARAIHGLGGLAYFQSDLPVALARSGESAALWRALSDARDLAAALNLLAAVRIDTADYAAAAALFEECLELLRAIGDRPGIARARNNQAGIARHRGDRRRALAQYEEAIAIWRECGDVMNTSTGLLNLGQLLQELGDYERAEVALTESLALSAGKGNPATVAFLLNTLGTGARDRGDVARARQQHEEALAIFRELGSKAQIAQTLSALAQVACDTGDDQLARSLADEGLALALQAGHQRNTAHALQRLGDIAARRGDRDGARDHYRESLGSFHAAGDPLGSTQALERLGLLAAQEGWAQLATQLLAASAAHRDRMGTPRPPIERAEFPRAEAALRRTLGDAAFAAAGAAGRALSDDEAVALALTPAV